MGQAILTSFLTVFSGVVVFLLGQVFIRFFAEPIQELKKVIGEIAHVMVYYANVYSNPGLTRPGIVEEARKALRDQASSLRARSNTIPFYDFFARRGVVPTRESIAEASKALIGLSNSLHDEAEPEHSDRRCKTIKEALGLKLDD